MRKAPFHLGIVLSILFSIYLYKTMTAPQEYIQGVLTECYQEGPSKGGEFSYRCDFNTVEGYKTITYQRQVWRNLSSNVGKSYQLPVNKDSTIVFVVFVILALGLFIWDLFRKPVSK